MGPMPYGITWKLILLKVLHEPPRPIRIFMPKSKGKRDNIHNNVVNNINGGIKARGVFMGPIPYEITWRLMLLKVLHEPPRPIRIFMPKSKGKKDNIHNNVVNNVNGRIKVRGVFMGSIPYRITWRSMLLKVLHGCPRPIEIFMPKSQRG
jgi:uncharacterized protein YhhL (DUF1145 family)